MKNKKNKNVIRENKTAGKFTTISHRILHDKRLTSNARLLLISILSDADSFTFSRTGLRTRIGYTEHILDKALNNLILHGYIRKKKTFGQYFHYTISEYGNLNKVNDSDKEINNDNVADNDIDKENNSEDYFTTEQYQIDRTTLIKYFHERYLYLNEELLKKDKQNARDRNDFFKIKSNQKEAILLNKKKQYKLAENYVNNSYAPKNDKPKILIKVKELIFEKHEMPSEKDIDKIRNNISHKRNKDKIKKYGFDYETQDVDRYENPLD